MFSPPADQSAEDEALERLQTVHYGQRRSFWDSRDTPLNWQYVVPASGAIVLPSIRMLGSTYFPKQLPKVFMAGVAAYLTHGFYLIVKSSEASTPVWYEQSIASAQKKN